jgi:hypothetical protein
MRPVLFLGLALAMTAAASTPAQSPPRPAPPPPPPEAKHFDFWIGEWEVTTADGKVAGTNKIEPISGGRGLLENWTSARGGQGKSLNAYNPTRKQWQQFWVGGDGMVLELSGGLDVQGAMVMTGPSSAPNAAALNRVTWTPNADGTVRQFWEVSKDEGKTWSVVFDGRYRRKG